MSLTGALISIEPWNRRAAWPLALCGKLLTASAKDQWRNWSAAWWKRKC